MKKNKKYKLPKSFKLKMNDYFEDLEYRLRDLIELTRDIGLLIEFLELIDKYKKEIEESIDDLYFSLPPKK